MTYIPANRTPVKDRLTVKILKYLSNPENPMPNRTELAINVCGYKDNGSLYVHFTGGELSELENRALAIRRSRYAPALSRVDTGILGKAEKGDASCAKLCYQRFEDWSEKTRVEGKLTFEAVLNQLAGSSAQDMKDITPPAPPAHSADMITDNAPGADTPPESL